jgi:hypothetical protein
MKAQLSASAEEELAKSSLFLWASGQSWPARLALFAVIAAVAVVLASGALMLLVDATWPRTLGALLLVLLVLSYCLLMFMHTTQFEAALSSDHLLPESEKSRVKVTLLLAPFARLALRRRLIQLAEAQVSQRSSAS